MRTTSKTILWLGIVLILITGLVHFIDAPDAFEEVTFKGLLFVANGLGAIVAAYGIWKNERWGWGLGLLIAAGSVAAYVASRTVGLPQLPAEPDEWLEPLGVLSVMAEALFSMLALWCLAAQIRALHYRQAQHNNIPGRGSTQQPGADLFGAGFIMCARYSYNPSGDGTLLAITVAVTMASAIRLLHKGIVW